MDGIRSAGKANRTGRPRLDVTAGEHSPRLAVRIPRRLHRRVTERALEEGRSISQVVRGLLEAYAAEESAVAEPDIDRTEIRRAIAMTDREREAYYLASNRNMLRMFDDARPSR